MHGSVSQQHAHSALSRIAGSSAGDAIDVDMLDAITTGSTQGTKRKNTDDDDEEVEIVEGPVAVSETQGKKTKGRIKVKK